MSTLKKSPKIKSREEIAEEIRKKKVQPSDQSESPAPSKSDEHDQGIEKEEKTHEAEKPEEKEEPYSKNWDPQELEEQIKSFGAKLKEKGKTPEANILNREILFPEEGQILLSLTHPLEEDILGSFKKELLKELKTSTGLQELRMDHQMLSNDLENRKAYTPKEKLAKLKEKYPLLEDLQKKLGLEPEY